MTPESTPVIEMGQEWNTKTGRKVTVIHTTARGAYPVVGLIDLGSQDLVMQYTPKGLAKVDHPNFGDLLTLSPQKVTYYSVMCIREHFEWVGIGHEFGGKYNICNYGDILGTYKTKEEAEKAKLGTSVPTQWEVVEFNGKVGGTI